MRREDITLTPRSKVPITVVISSIGLAIYGTIGYRGIVEKLDTAMTIQQAQRWIDDARDHNPQIYWPRLSERKIDHQIETFNAMREGKFP